MIFNVLSIIFLLRQMFLHVTVLNVWSCEIWLNNIFSPLHEEKSQTFCYIFPFYLKAVSVTNDIIIIPFSICCFYAPFSPFVACLKKENMVTFILRTEESY